MKCQVIEEKRHCQQRSRVTHTAVEIDPPRTIPGMDER